MKKERGVFDVRGWKVLSMLDLSICPQALEILRPVAAVVEEKAEQELLEKRLGEFDAYLASLHARVTAEMFERSPRLRVIATPTTGLDHIDLAAASAHGVEILSLKNDRAFLDTVTATAELTWGLLLAVARHLPGAMAAARRGEWGRDRFRGNQLSGKTLGIVGCGRLGKMVAEYGRAFRMNVLVCDVKDVEIPDGVRQVSFEEVLRHSDVVSIHIHLSGENRNLFDATVLGKMKRCAILLNTSRGAIINELALVDALEKGHLAGAGLDVIDGEWRLDLENHPLIQYANRRDNLLITPHVGGITTESQSATILHTMDKLRNYIIAH